MTEHNLFYYPYASFTNNQLPLLKVAALYFDKMYLLDPVGASWATIGADYSAREAVRQLQDAGILESVRPADSLATYGSHISEAIRRDMNESEFLNLCDTHGGGRWTLSLAKVPQDLQTDDAMRHLMGDVARDVAAEAGRISASAGEFHEFAEPGQAYDEFREGYDGDAEYRYADFPLALGEAIMMNHALFAGLLHVGATPITDDPFHNEALSLKLRLAANDPAIQQAQAQRAGGRQIRADLLAAAALTDVQLNLPILSPELPLEDVLEYRNKHDAALRQAREKFGWMARRIEAEPWSKEFADELDHKTIPDIADDLGEVLKSRDAWLDSGSGRLALKAAGIAAGGAAVFLSLFAAPITPLALASAGLGLATGIGIPGAEWLLDWRDGKKTAQEIAFIIL